LIELKGPMSYPTVTLLHGMLQNVPETGVFTMGGTKVLATEQLRRFQETGLLVPEWTTNLRRAEQWWSHGVIVLGRKENHTQGRDIIIRNGPMRWKQLQRWKHRQWWCRFVPSTAEWRIHVFNGKTIARGKKLFRHQDNGATMAQLTQTGNPQIAIRSRRNGWIMQHDLEPSEALREAARQAVRALGYPYGAVDLLETPSGPMVLEVNRLPAMDNYTATAYVNAIRRHVAGSGRKIKKILSTPNLRTLYEGVEVW